MLSENVNAGQIYWNTKYTQHRENQVASIDSLKQGKTFKWQKKIWMQSIKSEYFLKIRELQKQWATYQVSYKCSFYFVTIRRATASDISYPILLIWWYCEKHCNKLAIKIFQPQPLGERSFLKYVWFIWYPL